MKDKNFPITIEESAIYTEGKEKPDYFYTIAGADGQFTNLSFENILAIRSLIDHIVKKTNKEEQK